MASVWNIVWNIVSDRSHHQILVSLRRGYPPNEDLDFQGKHHVVRLDDGVLTPTTSPGMIFRTIPCLLAELSQRLASLRFCSVNLCIPRGRERLKTSIALVSLVRLWHPQTLLVNLVFSLIPLFRSFYCWQCRPNVESLSTSRKSVSWQSSKPVPWLALAAALSQQWRWRALWAGRPSRWASKWQSSVAGEPASDSVTQATRHWLDGPMTFKFNHNHWRHWRSQRPWPSPSHQRLQVNCRGHRGLADRPGHDPEPHIHSSSCCRRPVPVNSLPKWPGWTSQVAESALVLGPRVKHSKPVRCKQTSKI